MKRSNAKINDSARRDLCPPLSSDKDCFHTLPKATRTSRPSRKVPPSGGSSFAMVPGNRVEKIDPKSLNIVFNKGTHQKKKRMESNTTDSWLEKRRQLTG